MASACSLHITGHAAVGNYLHFTTVIIIIIVESATVNKIYFFKVSFSTLCFCNGHLVSNANVVMFHTELIFVTLVLHTSNIVPTM